MAYRNIEIDHLIIGYQLTRDDDRASDQLPPTVSGASDPRMLADMNASELDAPLATPLTDNRRTSSVGA